MHVRICVSAYNGNSFSILPSKNILDQQHEVLVIRDFKAVYSHEARVNLDRVEELRGDIVAVFAVQLRMAEMRRGASMGR